MSGAPFLFCGFYHLRCPCPFAQHLLPPRWWSPTPESGLPFVLPLAMYCTPLQALLTHVRQFARQTAPGGWWSRFSSLLTQGEAREGPGALSSTLHHSGPCFQRLRLRVCSQMPIILRSSFLLSIYVCYLASQTLEHSMHRPPFEGRDPQNLHRARRLVGKSCMPLSGVQTQGCLKGAVGSGSFLPL